MRNGYYWLYFTDKGNWRLNGLTYQGNSKEPYDRELCVRVQNASQPQESTDRDSKAAPSDKGWSCTQLTLSLPSLCMVFLSLSHLLVIFLLTSSLWCRKLHQASRRLTFWCFCDISLPQFRRIWTSQKEVVYSSWVKDGAQNLRKIILSCSIFKNQN